jgi:hypothetical protein
LDRNEALIKALSKYSEDKKKADFIEDKWNKKVL